MKASFEALLVGLFLLLPFSAAQAQGPTLSPIPNLSVNAGSASNVSVVAVDSDGRPITVTAALPPFATLNTPTIGTGVVVTSLTLAPSAAHVGDYTAAVTATAGGVSDVKVFQITVNAAGSDQAPHVTVAPWQDVTAGNALSVAVTAADPDGDAIVSLTAAGLPPGASFTPNAANTAGTFEWTPSTGDAGEYDILFTAANALAGSAVAHVRVSGPPTLTITPIDDVTVEGGSFVSVPVHASGVPGALITLTASLPTFATLDPPGSGTGAVNTTVTMSPPGGSAGTYHASITAISEGTSVTETFDIVVTGEGGPDNLPPVVTAPATASVAVGAMLVFDVTASDPDGDPVSLFGSALPPGSGFVDNGDGTGTFTWTPVSGQAGMHLASFTGLDGRGGSGSAGTAITVTDETGGNHPPVVSAPPGVEIEEGAWLSFSVSASDEDGDTVTLSPATLPAGASFTDHGDGSGTFSWTPGFTQAGPYEAEFLGDDGQGGVGTATTMITVKDVVDENHAPVLSAPPTAQVDEGVLLSFTVSASDADGDPVALSANALPSGATFTDHGDDTGTFSWTPDLTQSGSYTVGFAGVDGNGGAGAASTTITVIDRKDDVIEVPGRACLIGDFDAGADSTCFRINPIDGSFDLRDVVPSSIRLRLGDRTIAALGDAWIEVHCCDEAHEEDAYAVHGDDGGHGDDACRVSCPEHGDCEGDRARKDGHPCRGGIEINGPGPVEYCSPDDIITSICFKAGQNVYTVHADGPVDCYDVTGIGTRCVRVTGGGTGRDCKDISHVRFYTASMPDAPGGDCDTLGLRACFPTDSLLSLFAGSAGLPCALVNAEILATLTNGATVVATFGQDDGDHDDPDDPADCKGDDCDDDDADDCKDKGKGKGHCKDKGKGHDKGKGRGHDSDPTVGSDEALSARVSPNPLAPSTALTFSLARDGRVHVAVYDMQGRLVKRLIDEFRTAGPQSLRWDGTGGGSARVPSGVYFLQVRTDEGTVTRRVAVVK